MFGRVFALDVGGDAFYATFEFFRGEGWGEICAHVFFELGEFKIEFEFLVIKFFEAGLQSGGRSVFCDGVYDVVELLFVGCDAGEDLTALILLFEGERSLLISIEAVHFIHILFFEDIAGEGVDDGGFEGWLGNASLGAGSAFAVGEGAEIGLIFCA